MHSGRQICKMKTDTLFNKNFRKVLLCVLVSMALPVLGGGGGDWIFNGVFNRTFSKYVGKKLSHTRNLFKQSQPKTNFPSFTWDF